MKTGNIKRVERITYLLEMGIDFQANDLEVIASNGIDELRGLKENVIIGKLIPAGTGSRAYRDVDYELQTEFMDEEPLEQLEDQFME